MADHKGDNPVLSYTGTSKLFVSTALPYGTYSSIVSISRNKAKFRFRLDRRGNYAVLRIRDVYPDPTFFYPRSDFLPIPDPGSRGQKGTGSRIRIRNTVWSLWNGPEAWGAPGGGGRSWPPSRRDGYPDSRRPPTGSTPRWIRRSATQSVGPDTHTGSNIFFELGDHCPRIPLVSVALF